MPAGLWKMAEGSDAWAVKAPAKPIPLPPCSNRAKPAARSGSGAVRRVSVKSTTRARLPRERLDMGSSPPNSRCRQEPAGLAATPGQGREAHEAAEVPHQPYCIAEWSGIAAGGDALLVVGPEGPIVSEGEHQEVPLHLALRALEQDGLALAAEGDLGPGGHDVAEGGDEAAEGALQLLGAAPGERRSRRDAGVHADAARVPRRPVLGDGAANERVEVTGRPRRGGGPGGRRGGRRRPGAGPALDEAAQAVRFRAQVLDEHAPVAGLAPVVGP